MSNDSISRSELNKALRSYDKFGYTANRELIRLDDSNIDKFVPYMKFDDVCYCIDNTPTVECLFYQEVYQIGYEEGRQERLTGEWIPVSERMPKEEDYRPCYGFEDGCVMWQTDNGDIGFGWYYDSTKCWSDIYDHPIKTGKVIAWQPLPEPYEKGGAK